MVGVTTNFWEATLNPVFFGKEGTLGMYCKLFEYSQVDTVFSRLLRQFSAILKTQRFSQEGCKVFKVGWNNATWKVCKCPLLSPDWFPTCRFLSIRAAQEFRYIFSNWLYEKPMSGGQALSTCSNADLSKAPIP